MGQAQAAPQDFEGLKALLVERHGSFSRRLAQIATFAVAHPDEIAFGTAASVAEMAEVQPSTLVRFAQTIGYSGFSDLQRVFRSRLRDRWPDYQTRLNALKSEGDGGAAGDLLEGFADSATLSLARLKETANRADLEAATALLAEAETIYLLGQRRAFPAVSYLAYVFGKLGVKSMLIDNVASLAAEQMSFARPRDAVIAVSFTPYTPITLTLAEEAAKRSVPVVAVTDSPFSPLAPASSVWFEVVEADFRGFRSLAATSSLAMVLAVATAERRVARAG
ncbi:MAG: MurR/RpiR family transcriptional regulator [Kiloniellales bacterium]|nr:MurR/RpiR family transcriptional regulator [Kiloniellales bacterium]